MFKPAMITLASVLPALTLSVQLKAQESKSIQTRLAAFHNAQNFCIATIISNPQKAVSFASATKYSLSDICECAAMLSIANKSDKDVLLIQSNEKSAADMAIEIQERMIQCIKIK